MECLFYIVIYLLSFICDTILWVQINCVSSNKELYIHIIEGLQRSSPREGAIIDRLPVLSRIESNVDHSIELVHHNKSTKKIYGRGCRCFRKF